MKEKYLNNKFNIFIPYLKEGENEGGPQKFKTSLT